jgi:hypothetical protein
VAGPPPTKGIKARRPMPSSTPDPTSASQPGNGGNGSTPLFATEATTAPPGTRPTVGVSLPTGSYWEAHHYIGEFSLASGSRVLVSAVSKDGEWFARLRAYRQAERRGRLLWLHTNQLMLFPLASIPSLQRLLGDAEQFIRQSGEPPR